MFLKQQWLSNFTSTFDVSTRKSTAQKLLNFISNIQKGFYLQRFVLDS